MGTEQRIESFDPKTQDRTAFSCNVSAIDDYLKHTARVASKTDMARIRVALGDERRIVGFHSINAHSVVANNLPEFLAKKTPRHGMLPTAFISSIGVHNPLQGKGLGRALLIDALSCVDQVSAKIGICAILLDVFDCGDSKTVIRRKTYYESFGFMPLPDHPLRLFIPIQSVRQLLT